MMAHGLIERPCPLAERITSGSSPADRGPASSDGWATFK